MRVQSQIEGKLREALAPVHLEVINESSMHSVPPGSETHFKVLVVSAAFEGKSLVERHRQVNEALRDELRGRRDGGDPQAVRVHALSIRALTPSQWESDGAAGFVSPKCLGGSKADA